MNRKDLELIGRVLKALPEGLVTMAPREFMAHRFRDAILAAPHCAGFDEYKFLQRCGVAVRGDGA